VDVEVGVVEGTVGGVAGDLVSDETVEPGRVTVTVVLVVSSVPRHDPSDNATRSTANLPTTRDPAMQNTPRA